ncbi:MAG TPA: TonB-dependent receptor plug domain-containing protein, partial [Ferruginibacter sp.]|nr:TonB-dependent receptor plug domain-containing protein [Ferruginibacter sp.]
MKKSILGLALCSIAFSCIAQEESDSAKILNKVTITAFAQQRPQQSASTLVSTISSIDMFLTKSSLLTGMNAVAGVRVEERSPGSYRINIRGSSLRSPFGVRNIKIYWNDIPITDPSGNTYFNQFAWNNFAHMEIFKGPASSMYGAGTGGLVLLHSLPSWKPGASLEYMTGSYNLQNIFASGRFGTAGETMSQVTYAHNQSDGYRIQTKMRRDNFSWTTKIKREKYEMTASLLFTDMYYQTPGALTLAEFTANPKAARPAGGGFPSAVDAKAAIFQKNVTTGISNLFKLAKGFDNTTTLYGSFSQIKNSAIRNYERRNEPSFGGRTVFNYDYTSAGSSLEWQWLAGAEFQQGYFNTQVAKNKNGNPDTLQTNDDINNQALNAFAQGRLEAGDWTFTAGASITKTKLEFTRLSSYPVKKQQRSYRNELAPRFS